MSQIEVSLLAIAAALFSVFAVHRLTIKRTTDDRFIKASSEFRKVFTDFINSIENNVDPRQIQKLVLNSSHAHRQAADEFRRTLSVIGKFRFDRKWRKYEHARQKYIGNLFELKKASHALLRFTV